MGVNQGAKEEYGLPCTPLCKCYGSDCANDVQTDEQQEDNGDD